MTFDQCVDSYHDAHKTGWRNPRHVREWLASMRSHAKPTLGGLPIAEIDTGLVCQVIEPLWTSKTATAARVRSRIEAVSRSLPQRPKAELRDAATDVAGHGGAPAGLDWISCLRAPQIAALAADTGPLQLSLFDDRDLAEITSSDFPGERLVACRNPALAKERARRNCGDAPRMGNFLILITTIR